jgi:PhnB protein
MEIQSYLVFDGRCEEAIEFYKSVLGAKVTRLMRWKDYTGECDPSMARPEIQNKVMHASLSIGDSVVMVSDGRCTGEPKFAGFSLSLTAVNAAEADRLFGALAEGGKVQMPMGKTFFSPRFGMVVDRFGVSWMIVLAQ